MTEEATISVWTQTYAMENVADLDSSEQASSPLTRNIRHDSDSMPDRNGLAAVWAYMIFLLACIPCVAALTAQRRGIGLKWTGFGLLARLVVTWAPTVTALQGLKLFL